MGAVFRHSLRMDLGISILSVFDAVWMQHVTGSNACRCYLKLFRICLVRFDGVLATMGPENGHIALPERHEIGAPGALGASGAPENRKIKSA